MKIGDVVSVSGQRCPVIEVFDDECVSVTLMADPPVILRGVPKNNGTVTTHGMSWDSHLDVSRTVECEKVAPPVVPDSPLVVELASTLVAFGERLAKLETALG